MPHSALGPGAPAPCPLKPTALPVVRARPLPAARRSTLDAWDSTLDARRSLPVPARRSLPVPARRSLPGALALFRAPWLEDPRARFRPQNGCFPPFFRDSGPRGGGAAAPALFLSNNYVINDMA